MFHLPFSLPVANGSNIKPYNSIILLTVSKTKKGENPEKATIKRGLIKE
jgi:hypothetical protein